MNLKKKKRLIKASFVERKEEESQNEQKISIEGQDL